MVPVNLAVDSLGELFMTSRLDVLPGGARDDALGHIDGVASLPGEAGNCGFSFVHFDVKYSEWLKMC